MLECAIPPHLRKARTCPASTPPTYTPPFPSYCARFPTHMTDFVLAIMGAQYAPPACHDGAGIATIKHFVTSAPEAVCPSFWEVASVTDKQGAFNIAVLAYWPSAQLHERWAADSGFQAWWRGLDTAPEAHGWYLEVLSPAVERFETNFSDSRVAEGAANMRECVSGEVLEHGYWGSMRDRLAAAQTDPLVGEKRGLSPADGAHAEGGSASSAAPTATRIRVPGKQNLCVIRSGQDWSGTLPAEREMYVKTMHPVLVKGMDFLRDEGRAVGCYSMNLWDVVDGTTYEGTTERTFGLGYFDDLGSLERWSKSHPTHMDIFGGFLKYAKKLNNVLSLRLFHEVYVLEPSQQFFEYVGCHSETAMLNSLRA